MATIFQSCILKNSGTFFYRVSRFQNPVGFETGSRLKAYISALRRETARGAWYEKDHQQTGEKRLPPADAQGIGAVLKGSRRSGAPEQREPFNESG
jgi:hypothetical protein